MHFLEILRDSVETSVSMGLFKTKRDALYAHVYRSHPTDLSFSKIRRMDNFNPDRLQRSASLAYPPKDRPRGARDIQSVKHSVKKIRSREAVPAIWVLQKKKRLILLDGAHRIVAHYMAKKQSVPAFVIKI